MKSVLQRVIVSLAVVVGVFAVATGAVVAQDAAPAPAPTTAPVPSSNFIADGVCKGVLSIQGTPTSTVTSVDACQEEGDSSFSFVIRRIINIFSVVVGAVSVIMIIIGGFRYIISGGDSSGVSSAKNTILYAIVGLVIVIFAQVIIRFVLTNATPLAS